MRKTAGAARFVATLLLTSALTTKVLCQISPTETFGAYVGSLPPAVTVLSTDLIYLRQSGVSKSVVWGTVQSFYSGDCVISSLGVITCTKTNGVSFAPSATTDTTNASNITSGTVSLGVLPPVALLNAANQNLSGGAVVTPANPALTGTVTPNCGSSPLQWILNTANFTINAPTVTGTSSQNCALRVVNGNTPSPGAVTLANFSGKSPGGSFGTGATVSAASVSFVNGSASISWTANGLAQGAIVFFTTTGSLPTNFATGTLYYVTQTGTNSIQVSATPGGAAVSAGSAGSGTQTAYVPSVYDLVMVGIDGPVYAQWVQVQ